MLCKLMYSIDLHSVSEKMLNLSKSRNLGSWQRASGRASKVGMVSSMQFRKKK